MGFNKEGKMKKFILLLCIGMMGCATVKTPPAPVKKPVVVDQAELDNVISVFSETIKKDPRNSGAYYNRAIAYFHKQDYEKCWKDVHKAESLGLKFSDGFIKSLKNLSQKDS
ncbi:MAG: tetratricopeptide repeat protein [Candidatus Omnitrophica bacterium]|nr:tetratricopeptide repeat protein [Candidatus Omnitrophota bacterium]